MIDSLVNKSLTEMTNLGWIITYECTLCYPKHDWACNTLNSNAEILAKHTQQNSVKSKFNNKEITTKNHEGIVDP